MEILLTIQRILAVLVGIGGLILTFSEADVTAPVSQQLALTLGGIALIIVAVGWGILTGIEEDIFLRKTTRKKNG